MDGLIIFFILVVLIAFWWDSATAYENAYQVARKTCKSNGINLLDDTLTRTKLGFCRHENGYVHFCRQYTFEFSTTGKERYTGLITLSGKVVDKVEMQAYPIEESPVSE